MEGVFLTGWARKASEGLVGIAKRDGEWCAEVLSRYLETQTTRERKVMQGVVQRLRDLLQERKTQVVGVEGLRLLERAEKTCTNVQDCIGEFKFATNQDMLQHILQNNMSAMSR